MNTQKTYKHSLALFTYVLCGVTRSKEKSLSLLLSRYIKLSIESCTYPLRLFRGDVAVVADEEAGEAVVAAQPSLLSKIRKKTKHTKWKVQAISGNAFSQHTHQIE